MKRLSAIVALFSVSGLACPALADQGGAAKSICAEALERLDESPAVALAKIQSANEGQSGCEGGEAEASLLRAYAEHKVDGRNSRTASRLKDAVRRYEKGGGRPSRLVGLALLDVARRQLAESNERALETAESAERALLASAPDDRTSRARAINWQAAALLVKKPNFSSDLVAAFEQASRARRLFDEESGGGDPGFLEAVAWQAAILGLIAGDSRAAIDDAAATKALAVLAPAGCDAVWSRDSLAAVKRRRPWSGGLLSAGQVIGVVAIIDAGEDGSAAMTNIVAEARLPSLDDVRESEVRSRDKATARALKRWRVREPAPDECKSEVLAPLGAYRPERSGAGAVLNEWPINNNNSE